MGINSQARGVQAGGTRFLTAGGVSTGLFLDDFEGTSLTSRDPYAATSLNPESLEPSASAFGPPVRPTYTLPVSNGFSNFAGYIELSGSTDYVGHFDFTKDLSAQDLTWEMKYTPGGTSDGRNQFPLAIDSDAYTANDSGNNGTYFTGSGYVLDLNDGGTNSARLNRTDGNDSTTSLIDFGSLSGGTTYVIKVTRTAAGEWELLLDGNSQGTANDTNYTNTITHQGISGDARGTDRIDYFLTY